MQSVRGKGVAHHVYILRCSNGDLYTGYALDPESRLRLHNLGKASKFTRSRLPVELVHIEKFKTKSSALKRESEIKTLSRKAKLALIEKKQAQCERDD